MRATSVGTAAALMAQPPLPLTKIAAIRPFMKDINVRCILLQAMRAGGGAGGGVSGGTRQHAAEQLWLVADDTGAVLLSAFGAYAAPGALHAGDIVDLRAANTLMRHSSLRLATCREDDAKGRRAYDPAGSQSGQLVALRRVGTVELAFVEEPNMSAVQWVQTPTKEWTFKPREPSKTKPARR